MTLHVPCVTFHLAAPLSKSSMNSVPSGVTTIGLVPPVPVAPLVPPAPVSPAVPDVPAVPGFGFVALFEPQPKVNRPKRPNRPPKRAKTLRVVRFVMMMPDRCFHAPGPAHVVVRSRCAAPIE